MYVYIYIYIYIYICIGLGCLGGGSSAVVACGAFCICTRRVLLFIAIIINSY